MGCHEHRARCPHRRNRRVGLHDKRQTAKDGDIKSGSGSRCKDRNLGVVRPKRVR